MGSIRSLGYDGRGWVLGRYCVLGFRVCGSDNVGFVVCRNLWIMKYVCVFVCICFVFLRGGSYLFIL